MGFGVILGVRAKIFVGKVHPSYPWAVRLVTGRYVLGVLYGENRPKSENLATLTLRSWAPQPYVLQKSWPDFRSSETATALGQQRGVLQYLSAVHPVTAVACSEWRACSTDFRFQILQQMTPKVKIFENVFPDSSTGHRITFRGQIWWKSAVVKLPKCRVVYHTK